MFFLQWPIQLAQKWILPHCARRYRTENAMKFTNQGVLGTWERLSTRSADLQTLRSLPDMLTATLDLSLHSTRMET